MAKVMVTLSKRGAGREHAMKEALNRLYGLYAKSLAQDTYGTSAQIKEDMSALITATELLIDESRYIFSDEFYSALLRLECFIAKTTHEEPSRKWAVYWNYVENDIYPF